MEPTRTVVFIRPRLVLVWERVGFTVLKAWGLRLEFL